MYRITIIAGCGFDRNGKELTPMSIDMRVHAIREQLVAQFGGFTESMVTGGWKSPSGVVVIEEARQWVLLSQYVKEDRFAGSTFITRPQIEKVAQEAAQGIGRILSQNSVVMFVEEVSGEFVEIAAE